MTTNTVPLIPKLEDLAPINPIDCDVVYVEEESGYYAFDHTSSASIDGKNVVAVGAFDANHPTHANQPFMTGRWILHKS